MSDPLNNIIGLNAGLSFNQFAVYLFIPMALSTVGVLGHFLTTNRESFRRIDDNLTNGYLEGSISCASEGLQ